MPDQNYYGAAVPNKFSGNITAGDFTLEPKKTM
jgi:hypothetical protein